MERRWIRISGIVQGVGFRVFVQRLATGLGLTGFVRNDGDDVVMEVEGPPDALTRFNQRLTTEMPRRARIDITESLPMEAQGSTRFEIQRSR